MRTRRFVPLLLVLTTSLGGLGVGPVMAQAIKEPGWPPPEGAACKPSKGDDEEAQTLFKLAAKAEDTSNYVDAIKYYKDAYKRACNKHLLLKNLGRAYEKDAQYGAAVEAYRLFRTRGKPTGDELDQLDQKIANLSKKVGGTEATATSTATTAPPVSADGAATGPGPSTTATPPPSPTATSTAVGAATAAPPPASGPGVGPWIVIGAGGAIFLAGGLVAISANAKVADKQEALISLGCKDPARVGPIAAQCATLAKEGDSAVKTRTGGWVLAGVGGLALAGGLAWYFLSPKQTAKKTAWELTPGPTVAGLGLAATF